MEKSKRPAVLRSLYFDTMTFLKSIWQYVLVIAFFMVMWNVNDLISPMGATLTFGVGLTMAFPLQRYVGFYKQLVGFSLTKRNFLLGGILSKPMYMLFCAVLVLVGGLLEGADAAVLGWFLLIAAMGALLSSSYGELAGAMMLRWSRVGFILYLVLFVGFFMGVGMAIGMSTFRTAAWAETMLAPDYAQIALIVTAVSLVVSPLLHLLCALFIRRVEVRS